MIAEDTLNETTPLVPSIDIEAGKVYLKTSNGRIVAVGIDSLIDQLVGLKDKGSTILDLVAADILANLNLPGSGPAKTMAKNLAKAFGDMRNAQKMYFAHRNNADLEEAKKLEGNADKLLRAFNKTIELI